MTTTTFDTLLLPLYRSTTLSGRGRMGELVLSNANLIQTLEKVKGNEDKYGVAIWGLPAQSYRVGDKIKIELRDPRTGLGLIADTFDDVLKFPRGRSTCPRFFWLEKSLAYSDEALTKDRTFSRYQLVIEWVNLLAEAAVYFDKENEELVFLKDGKFSIPVLYSTQELATLDETALRDLVKRFSDNDKMREQMLAILAEAIVKQIGGTEPKRRFSALLEHLPETLKSFDEGHRLYVSNFSYEKVRDELQAAMLEELAKINKTFADVQGQILGIPVATVLVATQFKLATEWGPVVWVNTAVLMGVVVFVLLAMFAMRNQLHTLDAIGQEISRKEKKIQTDYAKVKDLLSETFPKLRSRLCWQRLAFWSVKILLVLGFVGASAMYFAMTPPVWNKAVEFTGFSKKSPDSHKTPAQTPVTSKAR